MPGELPMMRIGLHTLTRQGWEIVGGIDDRAILLPPGAEEQLLQFCYGRTLDPDRVVAPERVTRVAVGRDAGAWRIFISFVEVHAASEADAAVNDSDLAMVTVIRRPADPNRKRIDRIELNHLRTGLAHLIKECPRCIPGAEGIVNHVHLDPGLQPFQQEVR